MERACAIVAAKFGEALTLENAHVALAERWHEHTRVVELTEPGGAFQHLRSRSGNTQVGPRRDETVHRLQRFRRRGTGERKRRERRPPGDPEPFRPWKNRSCTTH